MAEPATTANRVKILRFRAWLECTEREAGGRTIKFPITSCVISVSLNAVPTATVTVATGKRLGSEILSQNGINTNGFSPVHDPAGAKVLLGVSQMSSAKILFRNMNNAESSANSERGSDGEVIFDGFIWQASQSYSQANTEISVTLIHWLTVLDAHPAICASVHPSSVPSYTQQLYIHEMGYTTDTNTQGNKTILHTNTLINNSDIASSTKNDDFIKDKIVPSLRIFIEASQFNSPWSNVLTEDLLGSGLSQTALGTLGKLVEGDTNHDTTVTQKEGWNTFPVLKWTNVIMQDGVSNRIFAVLNSGDFQRERLNSLWASLIYFASQFSFMLVPRVHELRFIPKWFTPRIIPETGNIKSDGLPEINVKNIREAAVVSASWDHARPICGAVIVPGLMTASDTGTDSIKGSSASKSVTMNSNFARAYYAHYFPNKESNPAAKPTQGTLLFREPPVWAAESWSPWYDVTNNTHDASQGPADGTKPPEPRYSTFSDLLAEEAYWDEFLKGRRMEIVCPLRFDICPGATVKVSTGVGRDVRRKAGEDALNLDYFGFVLSMRLTFDTISGSASSQYTLTHAHTMEENDVLLEKHPYFECRPFSCASWTEKEVKTLD
jgi:hypothetical protein